jgi:hypothetical protein
MPGIITSRMTLDDIGLVIDDEDPRFWGVLG